MGSRRKPPDRRTAREPDISLLAVAFNLPTPQDLERQANRRVSRLERIAQPSAPRPQPVSSRNISVSSSSALTDNDGPADPPSTAKKGKERPKPNFEPRNQGVRDDKPQTPNHASVSSFKEFAVPSFKGFRARPKSKSEKNDTSSAPVSNSNKTENQRVASAFPGSSTSSARHRAARRLQKKTKSSQQFNSAPFTAPSPQTTSVQDMHFAPAIQPLYSHSLHQHTQPTLAAEPPALNYAAPSTLQQFHNPVFAPIADYHPPAVPYYPAFQPIGSSGLPQGVQPSMSCPREDAAASIPAQKTQGLEGHFLLELQRIQQDLDRSRRELEERPGDKKLYEKLENLQRELNCALNSATANAGVAKPIEPSTLSKESQPGPQNGETPAIIPESRAASSPKDETSRRATTAQSSSVRAREQSPARGVRHHLCSTCGEVRSDKFHKKHPLNREQKPLLNYCGQCKDDRIDRGIITDKHHFCFGCGVVRSKIYQRQYAAVLVEPLRPNYCSRCQREVRATESIAEVSVLHWDVKSDHDGATDCSGSSTAGEDIRDIRYASPTVSGGGKQPDRPGLRQRRRVRRSSKINPGEPSRVLPTQPDKHSSVSRSHRDNKDTQRHVREPEDQSASSISPLSFASEKPVYQPPYVEEVQATTLSDKSVSSSRFDFNTRRQSPSPVSPVSSEASSTRACVSVPDTCSADKSGAPSAQDIQESSGTGLSGSSRGKRVKFKLDDETLHNDSEDKHGASHVSGLVDSETGLPNPRIDAASTTERFPGSHSESYRRHHSPSGLACEPPSFPDRESQVKEAEGCFTDLGFGQSYSGGDSTAEFPSTTNFWADISAHADSPHRQGRAGQGFSESFSRSEGFPPDFGGFSDGFSSWEDTIDGSCSFRSSRGAFSSAFAHEGFDSGARGRTQRGPADSTFASPGDPGNARRAKRRSFSPLRSEGQYAGTGPFQSKSFFQFRSSFAGSGHGGYSKVSSGGRGYNDSTASSGASNNPYYQPSRYAQMRNMMKNQRRARDGQEPTTSEAGSSEPPEPPSPPPLKRQNDFDFIPEPIIEEPESPPGSSPVRQMKLLEYHG
ncbi:hypothetical protein HIM_02458 [Hirsutella minnesotensis 3608]|nr:hypothetical protein HIM_02458 [Hirsutella minnesotensis 3608]